MNYKKIYALIVVFFPDKEKLGRLIDSLRFQVNEIILLNNGVDEDFDINQYKGVHILDMGGNIGIGGALNKGFYFLKNKAPEFVVTFDQDSLAAEEQISKLVESWNAIPEGSKRKGAIGPAFYDLRKGINFEYPFFRSNGISIERIYDQGQGIVEVDALITSGMLVPYYMYEDENKFSEELFIEFVDTEWCFRTLNKGFQHYGCFLTKMQHELSDDAPKKILGVFLLKYSPFRRYYYFRNLVSMICSKQTPFAYRLRFFIGGLIKFTSIPFIDDKPFKSLNKAIRGIFDGFGTHY